MSYISPPSVLKASLETLPSKQTQKVLRVLRWYQKYGDALVGEKVLSNINLSELQRLLAEPKDNLMFECYPVAKVQARYLQRRLRQSFDFQSYAYFVECEAD